MEEPAYARVLGLGRARSEGEELAWRAAIEHKPAVVQEPIWRCERFLGQQQQQAVERVPEERVPLRV